MMNKFLYILVIVFFTGASFAQEKMTVKPKGFDPKKITIQTEKSIPVSTQIRYVKTSRGLASVYPNVRILPTSGNQTELSVSILPSNNNNIFIGANTDNGQGYYYTTNAGLNWSGGDLLPGSIPISSNPACVYDNTGKVYFNYLDDIIATDRSTNGGTNWLGRVTVPSNLQFDKNHSAVDVNPSSPFYGRVYVVWSNTANWTTVLSYSIDGGASFSAQQTIGAPVAGHYEQGCNIQVAPNGDVYCVWATPASTSPYTEDHIYFTKSTNGGVNWSAPSNAVDINGIRGTILSTAIRVNSFPSMSVDRSGGARNGYIYLTWAQVTLAPAGSDADICFSYSSNGGTNWSTPVRVNNDAMNNGKKQFLPWMTVDQTTGLIAIIFYDTRDVSSPDSCNTYIATSADGGANFSNIKVSDHAQRPAPLAGYAGGYYGDYIGLAASNYQVYPFWMDNRSGPAQIYTARVSIGPDISHTPLLSSEQTLGTRAVNCVITPSGSGINPANTKLYYSRNNPTVFTDSLLLTNSSGNNWTGNITLVGAGTYRYYIKTIDSLGRVATSPLGAPSVYHSFIAAADIEKPVITHTPITGYPMELWPSVLTAAVTDNTGIDSVWVRWYKNSASNTKTFKLVNTSGNIYSAIFNSLNSDVKLGDSIFYRIIAQDISTAHNKDSTVLYKFKISHMTSNNVCVNKFIPIRDNQTTVDSFYVSDSTVITDVNFTMGTLIHTWDNDVSFWLVSPQGTQVALSIRHGASGDNYINTIFNDSAFTPIGNGSPPFTGEFKPDSALSVLNGQYTKGWWKFKVSDANLDDTGHVESYCVTIQSLITVQRLPLSLKVYLEGFWDGSAQISDTTMVYLANSTTPFAFVDSANVILSTTGTAAINFTKAPNGSYFIVVNHRNHLETWSKLPQAFATNIGVTYDFTTAANKAYGDNMKQAGSVWVLYGGDANRDGNVDALDVSLFIPQFGNSGYLSCDFNGDDFVDALDVPILISNFGLGKAVPPLVFKKPVNINKEKVIEEIQKQIKLNGKQDKKESIKKQPNK